MALLETYNKKTIPALKKEFGIKSVMAVPKIEKVVINTGFGKLVSGKTRDESKKAIASILKDLGDITGQKPALTNARKSIAGFKLREGYPIGAKVVLRKKRMYNFLDRLIDIVFPRSRDFKGIERKSVDSSGNLTIGLPEQVFFPEISPEDIKTSFGFEITIVTTAKTKEEGLKLFDELQFPLKKA